VSHPATGDGRLQVGQPGWRVLQPDQSVLPADPWLGEARSRSANNERAAAAAASPWQAPRCRWLALAVASIGGRAMPA